MSPIWKKNYHKCNNYSNIENFFNNYLLTQTKKKKKLKWNWILKFFHKNIRHLEKNNISIYISLVWTNAKIAPNYSEIHLLFAIVSLTTELRFNVHICNNTHICNNFVYIFKIKNFIHHFIKQHKIAKFIPIIFFFSYINCI